MIIGITGGTGSGKSTVCNELAKHGAIIFDADAEYKKLTEPGSPLVIKLTELFGDEIAPAPDRVLNRKILASKAFSNNEALQSLNKVTHEAIREKLDEVLSMHQGKNIILDIPLLFEAGEDKICDEIWTVTANIETRIKRVMMRDNISREEVLARIANQMSDEERFSKSQLIIENDTMEKLIAQVDTIVKERFS